MKRNRKNIFTTVTPKVLKGFISISLILAGAVFLIGYNRPIVNYTATGIAMGTVIRQSIYTKDDDITKDIEHIIMELEENELSWRIEDSEIASINASAGTGEGVVLSKEMEEDLITIFEVSARSGGAFDCTIGSVVRLWIIDAWAARENMDLELPQKESVERALLNIGFDKIKMDNSSINLPARMSMDMGAVGKGIACDRIAAYLEEKKVDGAVISVGGSILTFGEKPDGTPWQVGIVDPSDNEQLLGTLYLEGNWFVSTSGDYERYAEVDGVRYHHILDPSTGYPVNNGVRSVTIVCKSGLLSDALSTACFVLGVEQGMALAESYEAEALFVDDRGSIYMTEGMKEIFH